MTRKLREFQSNSISELGQKLRLFKKVVFQLATGGGKTVVMANISSKFIAVNSKRKVLILVHREELLKQTIKTIFEWFGIIAFPLAASTRKIQAGHNIYVGMVDTVFSRKEKMPEFDLIIIDEAHIGNFKKIHQHFKGKKIIGFTATPIASTKKDPLKNYYDCIVCGIDVPELIRINRENPLHGLVQNKTYSVKGAVDRSKLKMSNSGDFSEREMGDEFSKAKHVNNAYEAYCEHCESKKTIIFNSSIQHSKIVCEFFKLNGIPSRHIDSAGGGINEEGRALDKEAWRKDCIRWIKETPNAVLHNVGILTTGFDEVSIECIIVNRATASLALWLQMCGRGSRPFALMGNGERCHDFEKHKHLITYIKSFFTIIDLGGNAVTHGDWCDSRNWEQIFYEPLKPGEKGVAPVKECPECMAIVPAQIKKCPSCQFVFDVKQIEFDAVKPELVLFTKNIIVSEITEATKRQGYKEYYTLFEIARKISTEAKKKIKEDGLTQEIFNSLLLIYSEKSREWYKGRSERFTSNTLLFITDIFKKEILKHFKQWEIRNEYNKPLPEITGDLKF